ncbi:MAG: hypothetical protein ACTSYB_03060 [Candidatus Helarchaeota archaeon]
MIEKLEKFFVSIDLTWCDNLGKDVHTSPSYQQLLDFFPNLRELIQEGLKNDKFEYIRTLRHIFRLFKIYFLLKAGNFEYQYLSTISLQKIREKIEKFSDMNELYLPLILMYHDIGRFYDRKVHAYQSSKLIVERNLFDCFPLSDLEKLLLRKVIEYHLLLATIYTGESTFFGILSLLNDHEFVKLISYSGKSYADLFVDLLELFTYLDILGYPYSRVFDHYLKYYEEINNKLKILLKLWPNYSEIVLKAKQFSLEWLDWRLAGALRIFQFVHTKPHLTQEFYYSILRESLRPECEKRGITFQWQEVKKRFLPHIYKFQLKYALPLLMLLAFGEFKRFRLKENQKISPKLLQFWILLSQEVTRRGLSEKEVVWNIYFENLPFWSEITNSFIQKLEIHRLKGIINAAKLDFDEERKEYNLYLDFNRL